MALPKNVIILSQFMFVIIGFIIILPCLKIFMKFFIAK